MFDQFDKDKSGFLDAVEVMQMVSEWRVAPSVVHFIMQSMETGGGSVNFDTFYRQVCGVCVQRLGEYSVACAGCCNVCFINN